MRYSISGTFIAPNGSKRTIILGTIHCRRYIKSARCGRWVMTAQSWSK